MHRNRNRILTAEKSQTLTANHRRETVHLGAHGLKTKRTGGAIAYGTAMKSPRLDVLNLLLDPLALFITLLNLRIVGHFFVVGP